MTWKFKCGCQSCLDDAKDDDKERDRLMTPEWPKVLAAFKKADGQSQKIPQDLVDWGNVMAGDKATMKRVNGKVIDLQSKETARMVKEGNEMTKGLFDFCQKLEKTYAKNRKSPKNALAMVYTATHEDFNGSYPLRNKAPSDVCLLNLFLFNQG